ncbi:hypothetical protein CTI12_AA630440 [Artemisia annua]|uniref:Uncharacterized protein n=1 Tax=Artemisia annua TaxID=35608 RepID=A0A2U1K8T8_ARTAN|nr:hypothetical protein CTI12_AA630440 [Artemisia annua]
MVDKIEQEPKQEHDKIVTPASSDSVTAGGGGGESAVTWSRLQSWKAAFRKDEPIMTTETILIEEVPLLTVTRIWSRIHKGGPVIHKDTPIITTESFLTDVPLLTRSEPFTFLHNK